MTNMSSEKMGKESASCFHVSRPSHQRSKRGRLRSGFMRVSFWLLAVALIAGCDPIAGTGPGTPPDPKQYLHVDAGARTAIVTLIAGYPAGDYQFNYNGYASGALVLTVPVGWQVTVQCENRGTVPNSCAVVSDADATEPLRPDWSVPNPQRGLDPGASASFVFTPPAPASLRIASLVDGSEASGMWCDLEVVPGGVPSLEASG